MFCYPFSLYTTAIYRVSFNWYHIKCLGTISLYKLSHLKKFLNNFQGILYIFKLGGYRHKEIPCTSQIVYLLEGTDSKPESCLAVDSLDDSGGDGDIDGVVLMVIVMQWYSQGWWCPERRSGGL